MSRNGEKPPVRLSATFAGLTPLTALTVTAALSAWAAPAAARPEDAPTALLEVDAPMPPPHIAPANANTRDPVKKG